MFKKIIDKIRYKADNKKSFNNFYKKAENEVNLALKNTDCEYTRACYKSALRAYKEATKSLMKDGHSGYSHAQTIGILERLLEDKPLAPITDNDFVARDYQWDKDKIHYDCPRWRGMYKCVDKETNETIYSDVERCVTVDQYGLTWSGGGNERLLSDIIPPITMPYMRPRHPYRVHQWEVTIHEDGSITKERGEYNTKYILFVETPDHDRIDVNKLFTETENGFEELSCDKKLFNKIKKVIDEAVDEFNKED